MCWERQYLHLSVYLFAVRKWKNLLSRYCIYLFINFAIPIRFPEIRYFQDEDVRTKLTDILFCYARENEQLLYKQVRTGTLS